MMNNPYQVRSRGPLQNGSSAWQQFENDLSAFGSNIGNAVGSWWSNITPNNSPTYVMDSAIADTMPVSIAPQNTAPVLSNGASNTYVAGVADTMPTGYYTMDRNTGNVTSMGDSLGNAWGNVNGFVNGTLGGWGNVFQGIQALGNMYGGIKQFGLMQDQLDLAKDQFAFNKALTSQNLANQVKSYNTSLADRYRSRAFTETGNADAYNKQIEERKLDSRI